MSERPPQGVETICHDEYGNRYVVDADGNRRPPMHSQPINDLTEWTTYDTSQGHCGLCGNLTCRGGCFR